MARAGAPAPAREDRRGCRSLPDPAGRSRRLIAVSRQQAVAARSRAEASELLALGQVEIDRYPTAALAYTTRSLEINDTPEGRLQALRMLWKAPPARILPMPDDTGSLNLAFSRDGRWLAATGFEPVVALFSEDGRLAHRLTREGAKAQPRTPFLDFGGDAVFWWTWGGPEVLAWTLDGRPFPAFGGPQWWVTGTDEGAFTLAPKPPNAPGWTWQHWSVSQGVARLLRRLPVAAERAPSRRACGCSAPPDPPCTSGRCRGTAPEHRPLSSAGTRPTSTLRMRRPAASGWSRSTGRASGACGRRRIAGSWLGASRLRPTRTRRRSSTGPARGSAGRRRRARPPTSGTSATRRTRSC